MSQRFWRKVEKTNGCWLWTDAWAAAEGVVAAVILLATPVLLWLLLALLVAPLS